MKTVTDKLRLAEAVRVKSAEFWLKLGQPAQALMELQHLPERAQQHPWASEVFQKAFHASSGPQGF